MDVLTAKTVVHLGRDVVALAAVLCAAYLAFHGKEGWGWCLFIAYVAIPV